MDTSVYTYPQNLCVDKGGQSCAHQQSISDSKSGSASANDAIRNGVSMEIIRILGGRKSRIHILYVPSRQP